MKGSGYLATVLGAVIGGFALMWPFGYLGAIIEISGGGDTGFEGLIGAFFGALIGAVVGAALGAWIALRWRKHPRAGGTACAVAVTGPASIALAYLGLHSGIDGVLPDYSAWVTVPVACVGTILATRFAVLKFPQSYRP
jgi:hypothetical protein